jgi:hypothetical protein
LPTGVRALRRPAAVLFSISVLPIISWNTNTSRRTVDIGNGKCVGAVAAIQKTPGRRKTAIRKGDRIVAICLTIAKKLALKLLYP